jgi:signal transduction histidine kinase
LSEYRKSDQKAAPVVPNPDLNALVALQQEAQDQISSLLAENERLLALLPNSNQPGFPSNEFSRLELELRRSLQDTAMLQNQLAEANARNMMLERDLRQTNNGSNDDMEIITSIVQEIRQPLASINGYTDLLLSESVGILITLQRKFLERIQASTERLRAMIDDLIRVTMLRESPVELLPQPIELTAIIDGAVADTSAQLREKNIALRVDLPEEMPQIFADRDAIQQIILHLLQNAGAATPQENTITLRARIQKDLEGDFLLIQVTDTGCGVRAEDLPRVFARNFRGEKPLIQGLGDTGVGLSIARTLVEAHGGRIWVDSIVGQSTTFSILLPMHLNLTGSMAK